MTLVYANRVHEACSGSGSSNLTLLGALSGKATFTSKLATGSKVPYVLLDGNGVDYEIGIGTLISVSELARTTVMDSSATSDRVNSETPGTPVALSLTVNQHEVFIAPFDKTVFSRDENGELSDPSAIRAALFVETLADMTALEGLDDGEGVFVRGGAALGDGSGGMFYWDASDATSESPPTSYAHDTEPTGLFKRVRLDTQANALVAVETITQLKAIDAAAFYADGQKAIVLGTTALGDQEAFYVEWTPASSATANDWSVFRPSTGAASSGNGRWLRINVTPSRTFANSDATPSIANGHFFVTPGTAVPITDFDDAYEGQLFVVQRGAVNCTIEHDDTKIDLGLGGEDLILTAGTPRAAFVHVGGIHRLIGGGSVNWEALPDEIRTASGNPLSIPDGVAITNATFLGSSDGSQQFEIADVTDGDSHWKAQAGSSASGPVFAVISSNTNSDGLFAAKGTGGHRFGNGNGNLFAMLDGGGISTSIPQVKAAVTGFDNPVIYGVTSSETNKGVALMPQGNGYIAADDPDSTSTGGNARGVYSVDFQRERGSAAQVASGANAALVGGKNNVVSGAEAVGGGAGNTLSGQAGVCFGNANTVSGFAACVPGGSANTASSSYSIAMGRHALAQGQGKHAFSSRGFGTTVGSNQRSMLTLQQTTTDATQTAMSVDGGAVAGTNAVQLQDNSVVAFSALIVGRTGDGSKVAGYKIEGMIKRGSGAATVALCGTPTVTVLFETNSAWDCDVVAGTATGVASFRVTGEAATTIYWGGSVVYHEVVHA